MSQSSAYRAAIPPVPPGEPRPRWSVMIPTYNCARYLRQTLESVLRQAPPADVMQIEVVDDASGDDPAAVVAAVGGGRVGFFRHERNVGHTQNFAACLRRARGEIVHLLHGDDFVEPGFYRALGRAFDERPDVGAAFCRQRFVDERGVQIGLADEEQPAAGILDGWLERLAAEQRIMTPSIVVRRAAYERLGGFDSRLICSEDWEMWVRVAAAYPIWYEPAPLAAYRMHGSSNTGRHVRTAEDMRYTRAAIEMFTPYLPPERAGTIARAARQTYALAALDTAGALLARGDLPAAGAQLAEALRLSRSARVLCRLARLAARAAAGLARGRARQAGGRPW